MQLVMAVVIGGLYAAGFYLVLRRSIVKLIIGLALLANAVNLLIFTVGGLTRGTPALIPEGQTDPPPGIADPLPQALILTAIVIGFGVQAFALILIKRTYQVTGTDDTDKMTSTEIT